MTTPDENKEEERAAAFICLGALAMLAVISDAPDKDTILAEVRRGMDAIKKSS